jgi:hypothetical protein
MPVARVSTTLGTWIQVLGGIAAGMYAIVALIAIATRGALEDALDFPFDFNKAQDFADLEDALSGIRALASLLVLALVILLIIWLFQLTRSVGRHGAPERRWSPGWAVGGWFIPLANFVIPWLIFREGEKIAVAAASGRTNEWAKAPVRFTSNLWWISVVLGEVLLLVGGGMYSDDSSDLDEVRAGLTLITIGALLLVVGYALLIPVIRRITRYDNAPDPIAAS